MIWTLLDCVEQNAKFPHTFRIPSDADKAKVKPGSYVKLIFKLKTPIMGVESERMWVKVVERRGTVMIGTLENDPCIMNKILKYGDVVYFEDRHIAMIDEDENE